MKKISSVLAFSIAFASIIDAQTNPAITVWLQNTTTTGSHYVSGNSTPIADVDLVQVQSVYYTNNYSFISTEGIPAYITGPFLDGNPTFATAQGDIFKIPLNPVQETGTQTATTLGNIGVFIDGTSLFDYQDGVSYSTSDGQDAGGPAGGNPEGVWNRDAVPAEMDGFDCAKGHPAMGNYHHHQNPSAFDLDLVELSDVCDLYPADGLYVIDASMHSPLIGFAYDGFPIYGAYAYANADGTGGITRIKSSYSLRNITTRTHYADGTNVTDGPPVSTTYPLGHYREDYEFTVNAGEDYLDEHNGRFAVTPEYPAGTYAYYTTVDQNLNSAYPYVVGPNFYGEYDVTLVNSIPSAAIQYDAVSSVGTEENLFNSVNIFPNPTSDFIAVQLKGLVRNTVEINLYDSNGKLIQTKFIKPGTTIEYFDTQSLYNGQYVIQVNNGGNKNSYKVIITD